MMDGLHPAPCGASPVKGPPHRQSVAHAGRRRPNPARCSRILIDDGRVAVRIIEVDGPRVITRVDSR